ncbi:MAG: lysophospholipid acyltransferase family protein [Planctomycetota bacterium]
MNSSPPPNPNLGPTEEERASPEGAATPRWEYERADRAQRNQPWRRRFRHWRRRASRPLVLFIVPALVRVLSWTWRKRALHPERRGEFLTGGQSCIGVLWHGRMLAAVPQFRDVDVRVLVSMSGDGQLAVDLLQRFGYGTLRGSTNKSGSRALREMLGSLRDDVVTVAITPDGPRGPRHAVSRGPAFLARETGLPILPVGIAVDRAWYAKSWDRFTIPKPFARVCVAYGEPLRIAPDASDEELALVGERIRAALQGAEREAFASLGRPIDW